MIENANDILYFDAIGGSSTVFFDYSAPILPNNSGPVFTCGKDAVWLTESALERRQAARTIESFPNGSAPLDKPRPFAIGRKAPVGRYWHQHVNKVTSALEIPNETMAHVASPSVTFPNHYRTFADRPGDYNNLVANYFKVCADPAHPAQLPGWWNEGEFNDLGAIDGANDFYRKTYLESAYANMKKATVFMKGDGRPTDPLGDCVSINHSIGQNGGIWNTFDPDGKRFYAYHAKGYLGIAGAVRDDPYRWEICEYGMSPYQSYTFKNVPADGTAVELAILARCAWHSGKTVYNEDQRTTSFVPVGPQTGAAYLNVWIYIGSKAVTGIAPRDVVFTGQEIRNRITAVVAQMITAEGWQKIDVRNKPSDNEITYKIIGESESSYTVERYPILETQFTVTDCIFVPRITLGYHTKYWN